ncbi:MAG: thioredoxin family protein [Nitrosopumilus sp. H8]|nr:MAG: thioredoxin family protein [Nitrosopumilus sp. H8]
MVLMESQVRLKTGDEAPDFELMGTDGKMHRLSSYDLEGYLVIFMCNHCPYVKAKSDALNELYDKFGGKIAMMGINSNDSVKYPDDSYESMKQAVREKGFGFDYLVDETQEVARTYGATCTPDPFLFDSQRRLVFHGRIDNAMKPDDAATEKTMINNIESMLAGKSIQKDFDPSIGCSIKWKD